MAKEIERRFVVTGIDPDVRRYPSHEIVQGYIDTTPAQSFRVRIIDDVRGKFTNKTGVGLVREEEEDDCCLKDARFIMKCCPHKLSKTRHLREGWEVDFFHGPLAGLVLAEKEMASVNEIVRLPPWITGAYEVTESVTNQHLAWLATELASLAEARPDSPVRDLLTKRLPRIVFTGGPCSGKSTALAAVAKEFAAAVHCVPEAATIVIAQVGAKPPVGDPLGMRQFQRTLMRTQANFETVSELQASRDLKQAMIVDRGTVDGAAYLDGDLERFAAVCQTTVAAEYGRYDLVLCLETPPRDVYDRMAGNNAARSEPYDAAALLGARLQDVWAGHPGFRLVRNGASWEEKLDSVRQAISDFLAGKR